MNRKYLILIAIMILGLTGFYFYKKYGKEIQQMLNDAGATVDVDGYVGPQTVQAATNLKP